MNGVSIRPMGDGAVLATIGDGVDLGTMRRTWALAATARQALGEYTLDVVGAYASVLVRFDPQAGLLPIVMAALRGALEALDVTIERHPRLLRVGVCFGGDCGADFEDVARELRMTPAELRDAFCSADYRVAFLGFLAGFPYLVGLPAALSVPRLATPRPLVPAGTVAVAGYQCGIYPRAYPGGWRLIGRTATRIFDAGRTPPTLFVPGDAVRFESVLRIEDAVVRMCAP